jgi:hypothetical protein
MIRLTPIGACRTFTTRRISTAVGACAVRLGKGGAGSISRDSCALEAHAERSPVLALISARAQTGQTELLWFHDVSLRSVTTALAIICARRAPSLFCRFCYKSLNKRKLKTSLALDLRWKRYINQTAGRKSCSVVLLTGFKPGSGWS